jgi:hypothetical protein
MSPVSRLRTSHPTVLLIIATIIPVLTAIIGHQLGENGELGMLIGVVLTVAISVAVVTQPKIERQWYVFAALPVVFWVGVLFWFTLAVA